MANMMTPNVTCICVSEYRWFKNELRGSLTLDVDGNVHTVAVGMIVDIGDAVDALIP